MDIEEKRAKLVKHCKGFGHGCRGVRFRKRTGRRIRRLL